jgi:hypothetical protein
MPDPFPKPEARKAPKSFEDLLKGLSPQARFIYYYPFISSEERSNLRRDIEEDLEKCLKDAERSNREVRQESRRAPNELVEFFKRLTSEERKTYEAYIVKILEMADLEQKADLLMALTEEERSHTITILRDVLWSLYSVSGIPELRKIVESYILMSPKERESYNTKLSIGGKPFIVEVLRKAGDTEIFKFLGGLEEEERRKYFEILKNAGILDRNLNSVEDYIKGDRPGANVDTILRFWMGKGVKPEERKQHIEEILEYLKRVKPGFRIFFFSQLTPEERENYKTEIEEALREILGQTQIDNETRYSCVEFFSSITPKEREELKEYLNKILEKLPYWQQLSILRSLTSEERNAYRGLIEKLLRESDRSNQIRFLAHLPPEERKSYNL